MRLEGTRQDREGGKGAVQSLGRSHCQAEDHEDCRGCTRGAEHSESSETGAGKSERERVKRASERERARERESERERCWTVLCETVVRQQFGSIEREFRVT